MLIMKVAYILLKQQEVVGQKNALKTVMIANQFKALILLEIIMIQVKQLHLMVLVIAQQLMHYFQQLLMLMIYLIKVD